MQTSVFNRERQTVGQIELDESVFGLEMNGPVVHQAMVRQLANSRLGTHETKTRSQVAGSSRKLFRQKHTGSARSGNIRSPLRRHGGIIFGPHSRSYRQAMPKKARRLALKCVLSSKVAGEELIIIDKFGLAGPSTRELVRILKALGVESSSALVVTAGPEEAVIKSASNIDKVKTLPANLLNVVDLLSHRFLVMTVDAVRQAEDIWGRKKVAEAEGEQVE